jgi:competence ComEA-like helix-hairpin-helix protein
MSSPLIKINFDRTEEIAELYGIGSVLAERIVHWRESNGYFSGPEDLTRVDGIAESLAITLSPHIDWQTPENRIVEANGEDAILIIMFRFAILTAVYENLRAFSANLRQLHASNPEEWISTWVNLSLLLLMSLFALSLVLVILGSFTTGRRRKQFLRGSLFLGIPLSMSLFALVLGYGMYYVEFAPGGWRQFFSDSPVFGSFAWYFIGILLLLPPSLIVLKPELKNSLFLSRTFDFVLFMGLPAIAFDAWVYRAGTPDWLMAIYIIVGVLAFALGIYTIRDGVSPFAKVAESLFGSDLLQKQWDRRAWQKWINTRLPDPLKQMELKEALNAAYPRSRFSTIMGVVLIGGGGWMILTAISAIVQFFIDRLLSGIFK